MLFQPVNPLVIRLRCTLIKWIRAYFEDFLFNLSNKPQMNLQFLFSNGWEFRNKKWTEFLSSSTIPILSNWVVCLKLLLKWCFWTKCSCSQPFARYHRSKFNSVFDIKMEMGRISRFELFKQKNHDIGKCVLACVCVCVCLPTFCTILWCWTLTYNSLAPYEQTTIHSHEHSRSVWTNKANLLTC